MVVTREPSGSVTTMASSPPTLTVTAPTTIPTRISGSRRPVAGSGAVRPTVRAEGTDPDTQLARATSSSGNPNRRRLGWSAPVVAKLELDPEILASEERNHRLELVSGRCRHPDLIPLNRRLNFLETVVFDRLHHALGGVLRDALSE